MEGQKTVYRRVYKFISKAASKVAKLVKEFKLLIKSPYDYLWYRTQVWVKNKILRRPYTFIMQDWLHKHHVAAPIACSIIVIGLAVFAIWYFIPAIILGGIAGWLAYHLITVPYKCGQQEFPIYNPDDYLI